MATKTQRHFFVVSLFEDICTSTDWPKNQVRTTSYITVSIFILKSHITSQYSDKSCSTEAIVANIKDTYDRWHKIYKEQTQYQFMISTGWFLYNPLWSVCFHKIISGVTNTMNSSTLRPVLWFWTGDVLTGLFVSEL